MKMKDEEEEKRGWKDRKGKWIKKKKRNEDENEEKENRNCVNLFKELCAS